MSAAVLLVELHDSNAVWWAKLLRLLIRDIG